MSNLVSERTKRTGCVSLRFWVEAGEEGGGAGNEVVFDERET
jgi:hypothetical protein